MFTESATGLIVCVFQARGGNGEGGVERKKKKTGQLCRLKGREGGICRSRRCGLYISYNITSLHINKSWVRNSKTTVSDLMGLPARRQHLLKFSLTEICFVDKYDFHSAENYPPIFTSAQNRAET